MDISTSCDISPLDELQLQKTDVYSMSPSEIKIKLKRLFLHYSCIGTRNKTNTISIQKLGFLLTDTGVQGVLLNKKLIDIIISGEIKRNKSISFQNFCEIMTKLANSLYSNKYETSSVDALCHFLDIHIFPYYDLLKQSELIENFEKVDYSLDSQSLEVINSSRDVLFEIYRSYFP